MIYLKKIFLVIFFLFPFKLYSFLDGKVFDNQVVQKKVDQGFIGAYGGLSVLNISNPEYTEEEIDQTSSKGYHVFLSSFKPYNERIKAFYFFRYTYLTLDNYFKKDNLKESKIRHMLGELGLGLPLNLFHFKRVTFDFLVDLSIGTINSGKDLNKEVFYKGFHFNWGIGGIFKIYLLENLNLVSHLFLTKSFLLVNESGVFTQTNKKENDISLSHYGASIGLMYFLK